DEPGEGDIVAGMRRRYGGPPIPTDGAGPRQARAEIRPPARGDLVMTPKGTTVPRVETPHNTPKGTAVPRVHTPHDEAALDLRQVRRALRAGRDGDFPARLPGDWTGLGGKIADTFNAIVISNLRLASELERIGQVVGKHGKTRQRVTCENRSGA